MVVGVCRVVLVLPWNDSLKGKRSIVKSILERTRTKFHVAAAEVADLDAHRRATLGFACVSNDTRHARSMLDKLVAFIATASEAQVTDRMLSFEHYDGEEGLGRGLFSPFDGGLDNGIDNGDEEEE
jgi:uncharacterized protein YlxP (DUF503 family)